MSSTRITPMWPKLTQNELEIVNVERIWNIRAIFHKILFKCFILFIKCSGCEDSLKERRDIWTWLCARLVARRQFSMETENFGASSPFL